MSKMKKNLPNFRIHLKGCYNEKSLKERVHSERNIYDKLNRHPNIVHFVFLFSENVSNPININAGPALSLPRTCIITCEDLYFHFQNLLFCFHNLHYHFQDQHYFFQIYITV